MDSKFDPDKMTIYDFKMANGHVDSPEDFDTSTIEGYPIENGLKLGFNMEDKLVKADFKIEIKTKSKNLKEAKGSFQFVFIYKVENLEELANPDDNNQIELDAALGSALSAVTYSTSRGVLLTRLQGTALQQFILPIIDPNKLFNHN